MKKQEIEKRCREEMHQSIPDREALWQKIEQRLPEQSSVQIPDSVNICMTNVRKHSQFRKLAGIAACFLLIAVSTSVFLPVFRSNMTKSSNSDVPLQNDLYSSEKDVQDEERADSAASVQNYQNLPVSRSHSIAANVDRNLLGTDGEYFNEADVLERTECFVDVKVCGGEQDLQTGSITYELEVLDVYGSTDIRTNQTISITSNTPYILEQDHEYVLPLLTQQEGGLTLVNASAPQIECTQDGRALYHNGWYSLMNESSQPVVCQSYGKDDYFYDRMYLTDFTIVKMMIRNWEDSQSA